METSPKIIAFATKGHCSNEEARILDLFSSFNPQNFPFDRTEKFKSAIELYNQIRRDKPDLIVMEGTGSAAGMLLVFLSIFFNQKYIVSSGDAVADWLSMRTTRLLYPIFLLYEFLLYRFSSGFIGWSPYLVGRAISLGAPRAMTAPGFNPFTTVPNLNAVRNSTRQKLGIAPDALVFGIAGALSWSHSRRYCYGLELARALSKCKRTDVYALIIGEGTGLPFIRDEIAPHCKDRVILLGSVEQQTLPEYYAAMDVGMLPQSTDAVGALRFTTKLVEYLICGLPVAMSQIPASYDLDEGWLWRISGDAPWTSEYADALAKLMTQLTPNEIADKKSHTRPHSVFAPEIQMQRVRSFLTDVLNAPRPNQSSI